jgi:hypothetical protein
MKNGWRTLAAAAALTAVLWPVGRAQAVCTTFLADPLNPACKAALTCQKAIAFAAQKYVTAVQTQIATMINVSQAGGIKAAPLYNCVGGPNNGKACTVINGACKKGQLGKRCIADADCNAVVTGLGDCDRTKGCNPDVVGPPPVAHVDNKFECQVQQNKALFTTKILAAQTGLLSAIQKGCAVAGVPVPVVDVGLNQIPGCPGTSAPTDAAAYVALAQCIEESVGGDLATGNTVDTNLFAFQVSTGTGHVPAKGVLGKFPRMLLELGGTQSLQLGTVVPSGNGLTAGGNTTPVNLAHCSGGTFGGLGNGNGYCVNNKDCGTDGDGKTPGTCIGNTPVGNVIPVTGSPVFFPGNPNSAGPTLSQSATCSGGVATCLVTHTRNAGNDTTTIGTIDVETGHYTAHSPISTDVFITAAPGQDCTTFKSCPVCDAKTKSCTAINGSAGLGTKSCLAADQSVTTECPPPGATTIHVPNPFNLSTDGTTLAQSTSPNAAANQFCGFCDTSLSSGCQGGATMCSNGCQLDADCTTNGSGGTVCDFGGTAPGFYGDPNAVTVSSPGVSSQYMPLVSGVFCTGITSNSLVDNSAGLPSPVRVILPYTFGYVQTTDK